MIRARLTPVALAVLLAACGGTGAKGGSGAGDGGSGSGSGSVTLTISPADATLTTIDGKAPSQDYTVTATGPGGKKTDVTSEATFSLANADLGTFVQNTLTPTGTAPGSTEVEVGYQGATASTPVHFAIVRHHLGAGVGASVPGAFTGATHDAGDAPTLVYPAPKTLFPTNLSAFDVHWKGPAADADFAVRLQGPGIDLVDYVAADSSGRDYLSLGHATWALVGAAAAGATVTVTVTGLDPTNHTTASASLTVEVARSRLDGGVYYWAAKSTDGSPEGIWRHDQGMPGAPPEAYFTKDQALKLGHKCVACHVLSPDGTKMAVTFDGGNGASTLIDVAKHQPIIDATNKFHWNFAAFTPDGKDLLGSFNGTLTLYDATTGAVASGQDGVPTLGYATQPQFSPNGDEVVYVHPTAHSSDWQFTGGRLVLQPYDPKSHGFGTAKVVYQRAGYNCYYPSFSPDGRWLMFDESTQDAYDNSTAELYAMPADGSGKPIRLANADVKVGLTDSWPRWAPFAATATGPDGKAEPFYWFTFSSKRAFGVRLAAGHPQIWVSAFFPDRAAAGKAPAMPAYRLPDQDLRSNNHIAQWTQRVVTPVH